MSSGTKRLARNLPTRVPIKRRKVSDDKSSQEKSNKGHSHDHGEHSHTHGDEFEHGKMDAKGWSKYYESADGQADHDDKPHECLVKHKDKLMAGRSGQLKIFFPMCGQVFDMKYLADMGHDVTGVDYAESAIRNFFVKYKIPYKVEEKPSIKGKLYNSTDKKRKVKIYYCNIYKFSTAEDGKYDAIWDAGAMHSLPKKDLKKYVSGIKTLMSTTCPWLVEFTVPSCSGHSVGQKDLEKLTGFPVKDLGITKTKRQSYKKWGVEGFQIFQIQQK